MIMQNMLGKKFETMTKRTIYSLLYSMSDFIPVESPSSSEEEQKEFYNLLHNILTTLYDKPGLLNLFVVDDDALLQHECNNQKPETMKNFRKIYKDLTSLYTFMLMAGLRGTIENETLIVAKNAEVNAKKIYFDFFEHFGIHLTLEGNQYQFTCDDNIHILNAWKLLAERCMAYSDDIRVSCFYFYSGNYTQDYTYWVKRAEQMWDLPPDFINKYINQLRNMGYDIQMKARLGNNGLDAGVCCENGVGGICLSYEFKRFSPLNINSKTSIGYKAVMEDFNNQDDDVQAYIIENSAKCTGCKQCTKGKEVPIYAQKLNYQGKVYIKCPLYPSNCWTSVDKTRIERLIKIVDLQKQYSQK